MVTVVALATMCWSTLLQLLRKCSKDCQIKLIFFSFDTDPTPAAQTILAQKQYGIITIGYGGATDNNKLQTISGGSACSFTAPDFASLNNQIKTIQQLILNAK